VEYRRGEVIRLWVIGRGDGGWGVYCGVWKTVFVEGDMTGDYYFASFEIKTAVAPVFRRVA
jgi:hypothetical protein